MESVVNMINQTIDTLFCEFNYGKSETRKMMPHCRAAVEMYIFEKVMSVCLNSASNVKLR